MQTHARPLGVLSTPTFDLPVLTYLLAASLDTVTTLTILLTGTGRESNQTLADLASISLVWVPVYLLCRPLLAAFLTADHRLAYATGGAAICPPMSLNNISGFMFDNFFLYSLGLMTWVPVFAYILAGIAFTCYHVRYRTPTWVTAIRVAGLLFWVAMTEVIELAFTIPPRLVS